MINELNNWLLGSSLNQWIMGTNWVWPAFETLHFFGLCLLLGGLLVIDLRLVGFGKNISLQGAHKLLPLVIIGFVINLFTGAMFYVGDPERYAVNIGFQIKMVMVVLAGLNALWFFLRIEKPMKHWDEFGSTSLEAKTIGVLSLLLWFGVLACGRLIPYVGTG